MGMRLFFFLLALLTLTFWPVLGGDFLYWDDIKHIPENPWLTGGELGLFWQHPYYLLYIPVAYTFWMALYHLSDAPLIFHLANVGLHALNAYGVYRLLRVLRPESARVAVFAA